MMKIFDSGQVSPPLLCILGVFVCLPVMNAKYSKNQAVEDTEDFCNHCTGFEIMPLLTLKTAF